MDSTLSLQRRATLLFHLPGPRLSLILLIASSTPIPMMIAPALGLPIAQGIANAFLVALLAPATILIEQAVISSRLASFRRLASIGSVAMGTWLVSSSLGLILAIATGEPERLYVMAFLGVFTAISTKLLVFSPVFLHKALASLLLSSLQPSLLAMASLTPSLFLSIPLRQPWALGVGALILGPVIALVLSLSKPMDKSPSPSKLLTAFLKAWADEEPEELEGFFEQRSVKQKGGLKMLCFDAGNTKPALVIPDIHPGPLYPIGSSNLPYQLYLRLSELGYSSLVLHGITGHDRNLPSRASVEKLLSMLGSTRDISASATCTKPLSLVVNGAKATGIAFGDIALVSITLSPKGMEDFPRWVGEAIEEEGAKAGFKETLIVDAHNSQGSDPSQEDCRACISASSLLLKELRAMKQNPFRIGYSHSSKEELGLGEDVGLAGIGLILLEVEGENHALISVDANNASLGLREFMAGELKAKGVSLMELCTSDTHIGAGRVLNPKGYLCLGEASDKASLAKVVLGLLDRARAKIFPSRAEAKALEAEVSFIGQEPFDELSKMLDYGITLAKRLISISGLAFLLGLILSFLL